MEASPKIKEKKESKGNFLKKKIKKKKEKEKVKASEFVYRARQFAWIEAASHPRFYIDQSTLLFFSVLPPAHIRILHYALLHSTLSPAAAAAASMRFGLC